MARTKDKIDQYLKSNGKTTDSDFDGDPEHIIGVVISRLSGANKDICSGLIHGMNAQPQGGVQGSGALESVLLTPEREMWTAYANLLQTAHAFALTHFGFHRTDMESIRTEILCIADQCDDDGRGGLDRMAEAKAAHKAKAETVNAVTGLSDRIIMASVNGDADSIKAVIASGASEDLVKALIMSVTGDQPKRKQTAFLKACDLS